MGSEPADEQMPEHPTGWNAGGDEGVGTIWRGLSVHDRALTIGSAMIAYRFFSQLIYALPLFCNPSRFGNLNKIAHHAQTK